ncbi:Transposon Tf2-9 polyprotein [Nosema granulosis]|uniref:Transposon Tf2-9 polyprotein n=1 Tax=Nosema granulosis TaxID=83296 RepID=A0A9P6GYI5_9MICR|nr:Transposon Tf2-9 polyprotein [Nosema granulosis]
MTEIFQDMNFVKVFVDDILIFSKASNEHENHIIQVLQRCEEKGISVNYDKSSFMKSEVTYLGKIINKEGIKADLGSLVKIEPFKEPKNKKQLMRILGTINWFRMHIPKLSQKLLPLTDKLKEGQTFTWRNEDTTCVVKITDEIK